jgi:hypothetical protein
MLAIAAALNSTMVTAIPPGETFVHVRPEDGPHGEHTGYKGYLKMEMEDYWHYQSPGEADQFDREATLAFVAQLTEEEVLVLLAGIGKTPDHNDGEQWSAFTDALMADRYDDIETMLAQAESHK